MEEDREVAVFYGLRPPKTAVAPLRGGREAVDGRETSEGRRKFSFGRSAFAAACRFCERAPARGSFFVNIGKPTRALVVHSSVRAARLHRRSTGPSRRGGERAGSSGRVRLRPDPRGERVVVVGGTRPPGPRARRSPYHEPPAAPGPRGSAMRKYPHYRTQGPDGEWVRRSMSLRSGRWARSLRSPSMPVSGAHRFSATNTRFLITARRGVYHRVPIGIRSRQRKRAAPAQRTRRT